MFRKRKEARAKDQAEHVFILLDGIERGLWSRKQDGRPLDDDGRVHLMADNVHSLLDACDGRPDTLAALVQLWGDARGAELDAAGDENRRWFVAGVALDIGINSIGNLFGFIPSTAPAFDRAMASEGQRRGWRK